MKNKPAFLVKGDHRFSRAVLRYFVALCLCSFFSTTTLANEDTLPHYVPEGVDYWAPPEPIPDEKVLYVETNERNELVRLILKPTPEGSLEIGKETIDPETLVDLEDDFHIVTEHTPESVISDLLGRGVLSANSASSTCPLPSNFSVAGDANGKPVGGWDFHTTNRPPGTHTQWIVFDFYTLHYRGRNSHATIQLRHKDLFHGWGTLIGQNSNNPQGCGIDSRFNTQVQGWVQLAPFPGWDPEIDPPPPPGPYWQSFPYKASCGTELQDGPTWHPIYSWTPRYRMLIHAASSHWVAYEIMEWRAYVGWVVVTPFTGHDTDQPDSLTLRNWKFPPPPYDDAAEGIFVGATPSSTGHPQWSFNASNVNCGWF